MRQFILALKNISFPKRTRVRVCVRGVEERGLNVNNVEIKKCKSLSMAKVVYSTVKSRIIQNYLLKKEGGILLGLESRQATALLSISDSIIHLSLMFKITIIEAN